MFTNTTLFSFYKHLMAVVCLTFSSWLLVGEAGMVTAAVERRHSHSSLET